jgi:tRNA-2-methylthio-N6-dimethylallyladenosine synthase
MPDECPPPQGDQPSKKKLYIETVGCQMNLLDSELVVGKLRGEGYELTDDIGQADTILYNTCSVRQHAEDKIYSALGRIKNLKRDKPHVSIGVLGCMAQKDQAGILKRAPHVDVVIGPGQLGRVSELLDEAKETGRPQMAVSLPRTGGSRDTVTASFAEYDPLREPSMRPSPFQAFVRIMMGCDKFCTYCIVPSVRGPEQSRPPDAIIEEARALAGQGVKEITLLGQTVNSYKYTEGDGRLARLSDLLQRLSDIDGVRRIKFITNFPNDMTDDLLQAVRDLPKVSRYLHVPAQSGCDEMLKRMKRGYSVALYDDMLARIKATVPGAAVSSDFIVGFCGETEASFRKSYDMVERSRFKNSFIFKYSPRVGTKADTLFIDDVPEDVKRRRNAELLELQNAISVEDHRAFVGRTVEVLVEGPSKSEAAEPTPEGFGQLVGRTWCDRIVVFEGPGRLIGEFLPVEIERASTVTLYGRARTLEVAGAGVGARDGFAAR